jgi:phage baseplate assembly protein W
MPVISFADKYTTTGILGERYSDFYINFNVNRGTKDLARLTDENAIIRSIKNIIFTRKGEKPFNPQFGSNILSLLFENFNKFTAATLESEIETTIQNFEPRVRTIRVSAQNNIDRNEVYVTIYFNTINSSETTSVTILLTRIR